MKRITALALVASCLLPAFMPSHAATLETRSYTVEITPLCGERVVDCEQFAYAGTHNRNGSRINMTGKPGLRACAPRDNGCDQNGYQFFDGDVSYFVGMDGWLIVTRNGKNVLRERGAWRN